MSVSEAHFFVSFVLGLSVAVLVLALILLTTSRGCSESQIGLISRVNMVVDYITHSRLFWSVLLVVILLLHLFMDARLIIGG